MDWKLIFCMGLAAAGLLFGLSQWLRARRQLERMDRMLDRPSMGLLEASFRWFHSLRLEPEMSVPVPLAPASSPGIGGEKSESRL